MNTLSSGNDSSLWVDYLEGELDPQVKEDLDLLLAHSKTDQEIVKGLQQTKTMLMQMSEIELPQDEAYYRKLQDKIITKIEDGSLANSSGKLSALKTQVQDHLSFGSIE
jgi:hypothetical protein